MVPEKASIMAGVVRQQEAADRKELSQVPGAVM